MKTIILIAFAALAVAQEKFEVKELKPADVQELQQLNRRVEEATARLAEAQRAFEAVKAEQEARVYRIKQAYGETPQAWICSGMTVGEHEVDSKRVEVRGKYALITTGKTKCGSNIMLTPMYLDKMPVITQNNSLEAK